MWRQELVDIRGLSLKQGLGAEGRRPPTALWEGLCLLGLCSPSADTGPRAGWRWSVGQGSRRSQGRLRGWWGST